MKEETKSKLKKYGKRAGFGLGLVAFFLLGVGVGACSARKAVGSSAEDNAPTMAQPRRVAPPLEPSEFPTLDPSDDNLLKYAEGGHYKADSVDGFYDMSASSSWDMFLIESLPVGLYKFSVTFTPENAVNWFVGRCGIPSISGASSIRAMLRYGGAISISTSDFSQVRGINASHGSDSSFYLSVAEPCPYWVSVVNNAQVCFTLVDARTLPASRGYDFPTEFFPYGLSGNRKSEYFCAGPSVPSGTQANAYAVSLNGLYFECNGVFYNTITLVYSYRANLPVLYYTDTGALSVRTTAGENSNDPNYFPLSMVYSNTIDSNVEAVEVWQANFASVSSGAFDYGLLPGGLWVKPEYRHINVVAFYAPSVSGLPSSAIGQYSVQGWLDWLAVDRVVYDPTNTQGNPFTLLGQGFTAVGGILQIQILPMITLGTLIFVPLIVLVIMAILKILNK